MRKHPKRILSLLLALVLCLGLLPMTALADWTNEGDLEDVRVITDNKGAKTDPEPGRNTGEGDLEDVRVITDNKGANAASGGGEKEEQPDLSNISIITSVRGGVTFNASPGKFPDGRSSVRVEIFPEVWNSEGGGIKLRQDQLPETPVWDGHTFIGWFTEEGRPVMDVAFTTGATVTAKWEGQAASGGSQPVQEHTIIFNANGGKFSDGSGSKSVTTVSGFFTFTEVPTREGYAFEGWKTKSPSAPVWPPETFVDRYLYNDNQLFAVWKEQAASGGNQTGQELNITFDANGGTFPDGSKTQIIPTWPEGYIIHAPDTPTREGYTFVDWGGIDDLKYHAFTADTTVKATWKAQAASANPNGPFTVKFDLNFADKSKEKASERPKAQTIAKGSAVSLPDGSKLTPPSDTSEFYAWCVLTKDEKGETVLFPWRESDAVTADMTLYAGWIRKGTVVKDGEAIKPVDSTGTSKPDGTTGTVSKTVFADVVKSSPFADAISWAVDESITKGTSLTTFSPNNTCTRGHILTFLWRSQGSPEPTVVNPYKDEIPNAFQKAAVWAHEKGLVTGDTFGSSDPCTRASSVTYMWKLAGSPEAKAASFKDVAASSDYAKAVSWAVEQGVTNGTGDGTSFSPENTCTRGQIVTFLYRAYKK